MSEKLRRALIVLCIAVIIFCLLGIGNGIYQNRKAKKIYAETIEIAFPSEANTNISIQQSADDESDNSEASDEHTIEVDQYAQSLLNMNFEELKKTNSDVVGWIIIPDTAVSYPIVQSKDNKYYLRRAWTKEQNIAGSIFMDYHSSKNFDSFNTIIYGHHMINNTMFGPLLNYKDGEYFDLHPYIYIATDDTVHRYSVFAAYEADVKSKKAYRIVFNSIADKEDYISYCLESSVVQSATFPITDRPILTLSTCTESGLFNTRWVVQGFLDYSISSENTALE